MITNYFLFKGKWRESTHPRHFPGIMARWSPLIGASHSKDYIIWEYGGMASAGVTMVSEWGAVYKLIKEMKSQGGNVYRYTLRKKAFHQLCWRRRLLTNFKTRSKIWDENEYFVQIARTLSAMGSVKLRFFLKFCSPESWNFCTKYRYIVLH